MYRVFSSKLNPIFPTLSHYGLSLKLFCPYQISVSMTCRLPAIFECHICAEVLSRSSNRSLVPKVLIIRFKILTFLCKVLTKVYPFLFLFLVFGSLISGPLFIINTPQKVSIFISQALAEESSDDGEL